jgi:membrane associated rhomboid family serine protease
MPVLRRVGSKECVAQLWRHAHEHQGAPGAACPVCQRKMVEVDVPLLRGPLRLDVCTGCEFVWFDPREFELFPPGKAVRGPSQLPDKTREAIALAEVERIGAEAAAEESAPDETWQWLPGLLGLPVKENSPPLRNWPVVTWGLAVALVAIFLLTVGNQDSVIEALGLVPSQPWRYLGLTFVTNFFLHAGFFHLLGNVYFLLVFGDNVEDDLGWQRYIVLLALSALIGDVLHVLGNLHGVAADLPSVGASGGISGVITYYALRFPQARLGILFRYFVYFRWVHLPASAFLLFWFAMQLLFAIEQQAGISNVAALAHLGGAAVGAVAWAVWHVRNRQSEPANASRVETAASD